MLQLIRTAIYAKTGDHAAAQHDVAQAVLDTLNMTRRTCPVCDAEAFAVPGVYLFCGTCGSRVAMRGANII